MLKQKRPGYDSYPSHSEHKADCFCVYCEHCKSKHNVPGELAIVAGPGRAATWKINGPHIWGSAIAQNSPILIIADQPIDKPGGHCHASIVFAFVDNKYQLVAAMQNYLEILE